MAWWRALRAESLKLRHTLALRMVVLSPLAIAVLTVLQFAFVARRMPPGPAAPPAAAWHSLGESVFGLWCLLMLPLFVTLETALLAGLEHNNGQWKHLEALPVPRRAHYLGKATVATLMVACAYLILFALVPLSGWALEWVAPALGIAGMPVLAPLVVPVIGSFIACLLMTSLQMWIALRWKSFTVAVSVGIVATMIGFILGRSDSYGMFYPWSMPLQAFSETGNNASIAIGLGLFGGALVAALGLHDFLRRDNR